LILGKKEKKKANFYIVYYFLFRCGSGLSGEVLTDLGHQWIGLDISTAMLGLFFKLNLIFIFFLFIVRRGTRTRS
jgi:hypothetical protein